MTELLFLAHRAPFPPDRGDRIRSFHVLRHLAARARVHLLAFADGPAEAVVAPELAALTASVTLVPRRKGTARAAMEALATGRAVSLAAFADPRMTKAVADVLACHPIEGIYAFSGQMAQYLPADRPARTVMDFVDVDSAKFAQFAETASGPKRWMMQREARLLGRFECEIAMRSKAALFVSEAEAALFQAGGGRGQVRVVENGIDAAFFEPKRDSAAPRDTIIFTGQMDYAPNVEAVTWFADTVLPRIRAHRPAARFLIVGRSPTAVVRALARRDAVEVTGEVDDVRVWLARATLAVAPLHLARGIQNKVLEAMSFALPVVATPAAAEGIDHAGTLSVAEGEEAFAVAVLRFLEDPEAAEAAGRRARARVLARYDWDARLAPLEVLLGLGGKAALAA